MRAFALWMKTFFVLWVAGGVAGFAAGFFLIAPMMHDVPRAVVASIACVVGAFVCGSAGYLLLARIQKRSHRG